MEDLKDNAKKLQIFYTFVSNFDVLNKTIRDMALSGSSEDYMRAEGLCDIIASFVYGKTQIEEVIEQVRKMPCPQKIAPLVQDLIKDLEGQRDSLMMQLAARYEMLLGVLLLRDTVKREDYREELKEETVEEEEGNIIREDPGNQIRKEDLTVLNEIATANLEKGVLLSDFSKRFKTPEVRDTIKRLYYETPYYFEQAFSNTDMNIQYIILEVIEEDIRRNARDEQKMNALQALRDLHILSTIDTSANKMTSKVSDHQAFELFIHALEKNDNDFIINKLVNDNVIMNTLFDISTKDKENYYGFRRMFTTAKHPYDGIILEKYKKLKNISMPMFQAIVKELSRDENFKESYENYLKTERTHEFLKVLKETRSFLFKDELTDEMVYSLCYLLDEFTKMVNYNHDLLTMEMVMMMVEDMYWYIIRKDAFGRYVILEEALSRFFSYRIDYALNSTRLAYKAYGGEDTFGITAQDLWFDLHKMIKKYNFNHLKRIYLRYEQGEVFYFDIDHKLKLYEEAFGSAKVKGLTKGEISFICSNKNARGFEQYVFNLYGRFIKAFMEHQIHTKLLSIKTSAFRKVEIPGLSVKDDQRIRKAVLDYLTLLFLWEKDHEIFLHVYKTRVGGVLNALDSMTMSNVQMKPYVRLESNKWLLEIFNYKGLVRRLSDEYDAYIKAGKDKLFANHAENFFQMTLELQHTDQS